MISYSQDSSCWVNLSRLFWRHCVVLKDNRLASASSIDYESIKGCIRSLLYLSDNDFNCSKAITKSSIFMDTFIKSQHIRVHVLGNDVSLV